ncbi:MAG: hypothetical protein ACLQVI_22615 [Polyangiaceae bacterium]
MKSVANPFSRPSAAPENPEVLSLSDYRAPVTPPATSAPDAAAVAVVPSVAPKPLPPPEMEEKKIRVSVKLTAAEHWELKKRIASSNMGVDEYLRTLLFPAAT